VPLDVQALVEQTYDAGDYRNRIDYAVPCTPPPAADDREWAAALIRQAALGGG
jgi:hypothetical protein